MVLRRGASRATRLSKHWVHVTKSPTSLGANSKDATDMLLPWRTAFGPAFATMTSMRIVLDLAVRDNGISTGDFVWGILSSSLNSIPVASPGSSNPDDFTEWVGWGHHGVFSGATPQPETRHLDLRAMRKFDPSRETLWLIAQTLGGGVDFVTFSFGARILCGD